MSKKNSELQRFLELRRNFQKQISRKIQQHVFDCFFNSEIERDNVIACICGIPQSHPIKADG